MAKNISKSYDHVIGAANATAVTTNPKARLNATIQSLVLSELLSICECDELPIETVLDKIEAMEREGWEPTLHWIGNIYLWESFRDEWEMSAFEQEIYAIKKAKKLHSLE